MKSHPLIRLLKYADNHRGAIYLASLYSVLNKLFDLAPPILIGLSIDILVSDQDSFIAAFGYTDRMTQLYIMAGITVFVWGMESLFQYLFALKWRNIAQDLQHEARMDAYAHVQELEMAYFEDRSTGGLMSILNNDVNQLERFLDTGANQVIQVIVTVVAIGAYFMTIAPSVAWMAVVPMPLIVWGSIVFQRRLAPKYANVREKVSMLNGQLSNNLSGIATIKSFATEDYEIGRIADHSNAYRNANRDAIKLSASFVPLIRMAIMSGFIAILIYGGKLVIQGALAVGLYSTLVYMTQRLLWPLTSLGQTLDLYQRAMASTARLLDLLDTDPTLVSGNEALKTETVRGGIRFANVSFSYANGTAVIENLSFEIPAGQTVAFVGSTGSGKTTLIKLLLRLYDVTDGSIYIDGVDVRELDMQDLRRAVGLVSQDVYLFHGTAYENIAYGTFGATDDDVFAAARTGEAHDFISKLPDGYDTIVGERGQKLSGGQRQRLSIARAVLKDPPLLVLDEATSAVDNETEAAIQRSMERISVGRTTILIAHRLSTVRNADRIYVLEEGKITEDGDHETLLAQNGTYADLWRIQTGERAV